MFTTRQRKEQINDSSCAIIVIVIKYKYAKRSEDVTNALYKGITK